MPPVRWLPPKKIYMRAPSMKPIRMKEPDIRFGTSIIAAGPRVYQDKQINVITKMLKTSYGKQNVMIVDIHATRAACRRVLNTKMGGGRGPISYFVGSVPAGKIIVQNPTMPCFEDFNRRHQHHAFHRIAQHMPNACYIRAQFNRFKEQSLNYHQTNLNKLRDTERFNKQKIRLCNTLHIST